MPRAQQYPSSPSSYGAALLLTAVVVGCVSGCAVAPRPTGDGDSPQYARHAPLETGDLPPRVSVPESEISAE
jgi:hypothetical protein